jgi:signal peptidase II
MWKIKFFLIIILIATVDLSSKYFVKNTFIKDNNKTEFVIIENLLEIKNLCNPGISFGIFGDLGHKVLSFAVLIIILALIIYAISIRNYLVEFGLIVGGAIANLIDRITQTCVYDFIDIHWKNVHFFVFNIADAAISFGVILYLIKNLFNKNAQPDIGIK